MDKAMKMNHFESGGYERLSPPVMKCADNRYTPHLVPTENLTSSEQGVKSRFDSFPISAAFYEEEVVAQKSETFPDFGSGCQQMNQCLETRRKEPMNR